MYKKDESNRNDAAWRVQTKPQNSKNMSFLWFGLIEIDSSTQLTNHRATCMNKKSTLWVRARVPTKVVWLPFYVLQRKPFGVLGVLLDKLPNLLLCAMYYIYNVYIYIHTIFTSMYIIQYAVKTMRHFHKHIELSATRFCFFSQKSQNVIEHLKKTRWNKSLNKHFRLSQPSPVSLAMAGLSQSQPLPPRRPPSVDARPETVDGARERSPSPNTEYLGGRVQQK